MLRGGWDTKFHLASDYFSGSWHRDLPTMSGRLRSDDGNESNDPEKIGAMYKD